MNGGFKRIRCDEQAWHPSNGWRARRSSAKGRTFPKDSVVREPESVSSRFPKLARGVFG